MNIVILKRQNDFMAYLEGNISKWESGNTPEEAIGKLIISLYGRGEGAKVKLIYR